LLERVDTLLPPIVSDDKAARH